MAGDTPITVVGNLTADPELRFTPSGAAVANFTVASTPRTFDRQTNEWKDQDTLFLNCSVWRQAAENAAESLTRGMRVIVQGRLKARSYETREGEKRTVFEIDVEEVGPSLRSATAKVAKTSRSGGGQGFQSGGGDDPWASNQGSQGGGQRPLPPAARAAARGAATRAAARATPAAARAAASPTPGRRRAVGAGSSEEPPF